MMVENIINILIKPITTAMIYKSLQVLAICFITIPLSGQDMFPARQLTFDPAQQGFATWSPDSKSIVYQHTDMYSDHSEEMVYGKYLLMEPEQNRSSEVLQSIRNGRPTGNISYLMLTQATV